VLQASWRGVAATREQPQTAPLRFEDEDDDEHEDEDEIQN
jgi:hypothetical protein